MKTPRILHAGGRAVVVEFASGIDPAANAAVLDLDAALNERPFKGFVESVPTHRSLLVVFDPALARLDDLTRAVAAAPVRTSKTRPSRLHVIPAAYGGEAGPDLDRVASQSGMTAAELVRRHTESEYLVSMLGFLPGFAYMRGVDPAIVAPRLASPRPRVEAGSIGIADGQTGVYPAASPGGWNLVGRTSLRAFDPSRTPPSLFASGDRVRFEATDAMDFTSVVVGAEAAADLEAAVVVEDPGLLSTIQDAGRVGLRRFGVASAGAVDLRSLAEANRAVGNDPGAAAVECSVVGPRLSFRRNVHFALGGGDFEATLVRPDLGEWRVPRNQRVLARAGNELRFAGRVSGCRAVIAFAGGVDVPLVLGSRSTDLVSRFGGLAGRALQTGDALRVRTVHTVAPLSSPAWDPPATAALRVVLGPQDDLFPAAERDAFFAQSFAIDATSDRVGARCRAERPLRATVREIASDAMVAGSIQVPPSGDPIVMLADGPTTGGYPKIATVLSVDLPLLAQALPGAGSVRFEPVSPEDAMAIEAARRW